MNKKDCLVCLIIGFVSVSLLWGQEKVAAATKPEASPVAQTQETAAAQPATGSENVKETTAEAVIKALAHTQDWDLKSLALKYVGQAINRGNKDGAILATLDFLASESVGGGETLLDGRVINNYPDIRRYAASYLGMLGTEGANDTLLRLILLERDPTVLATEYHALGMMAGKTKDAGRDMSYLCWSLLKCQERGLYYSPLAEEAMKTLDVLIKTGGRPSSDLLDLFIDMADDHRYSVSVRRSVTAFIEDMMNNNTENET
jgi:hypothetical protein